MRRSKRTARHLRPPVQSALDTISNIRNIPHAVQTNPPRQNIRSRSKEQPSERRNHGQSRLRSTRDKPPQSNRRQSRKNEPPEEEPPFLRSPSNVWQRLPITHRIVGLLSGFLYLYYLVFAKHHHYDKEIVAIHEDVEKLMKEANGFGLSDNLVEAELPDIFKTTEEDISSPIPSSSPSPMQKAVIAVKGKGVDDLPLKKKKKKKKKKGEAQAKGIKSKTAVAGGEGNGTTAKSDGGLGKSSSKASGTTGVVISSEVTTEGSKNNEAGATGRNQTQKKISGGVATGVPVGDSDATIAAGMMAGAPNSASKGSVTSGNGIPSEGGQAVKTGDGVVVNATATSGSGESGGAGANGTVAVSEQGTRPVSGGAVANTISASPVSEREANGTSKGPASAKDRGSKVAGSTDEFMKPEEKYDYSEEFKDIEPGDPSLPKDHWPLLDWNYDAVLNPETTEQIFGIGTKLDHVASYKPLCINPADGKAIVFAGNKVCSGFNRTAGWLRQYCVVMRESLKKEYLLELSDEEKPKKWLKEQESSIHWINGLTILQILEKNCGNIAHFSGRALMLQHIMENIAAYASPPSAIENILILPTYHIMKRFLYPHNYGFWHKSLLTSLIAPAHFTIGTLGNFLYREEKVPYNGTQRVQLLHNFSVAGSVAEGKKYVCFRRAIVPGYFKARFFVDDMEYPSKKASLQSSIPEAPRIPRDSLRFRERVSATFHQTPKLSPMRKEIIFMDRNGKRRVFANDTKKQVIDTFRKVAMEKGYTFKLVSFNNMTFRQQYDMVEGVALAVGIHGANLVNSMFLPPLAVLIELFPFGFMHEMYINGGNAGLKYFKYQMATGLPFDGPKMYQSVQQCIKLNQKCKVHYRDAMLQVTPEDLTALEALLREAIEWCDAQPKPASTSAAAAEAESGTQKKRRRLLRVKETGRQK